MEKKILQTFKIFAWSTLHPPNSSPNQSPVPAPLQNPSPWAHKECSGAPSTFTAWGGVVKDRGPSGWIQSGPGFIDKKQI